MSHMTRPRRLIVVAASTTLVLAACAAEDGSRIDIREYPVLLR